jgi:polysaccharide deacetylase 2 family uncharacterized protein YibQ
MKALVITASIVLSVLAFGIAGLAYFPDADSGDPVAILSITPVGAPGADVGAPTSAPRAAEGASGPGTAASPGGAGAKGEITAPPGFAVEGVPNDTLQTRSFPPAAPEQQAGTEPGAPQVGMPGISAQPQAMPEMPKVAVGEAPAPASVPFGAGPPGEVPVAELVEESSYGPLPKVAPDGRRPLDVYAMPSRYAAKAAPGEPARVAVLINGMGLADGVTVDAIKGLPGPISVAYGAYGRNLQDWVTKARAAGHEVLLQIPLEAQENPNADSPPHTLLTSLPPEENLKRLQWLMSRFTGYVGVTNYKGGKFESAQDSFLPVLEELKARGLLYLDDGSAQGSTAGQIASTLGLDYSVASVQIDASQTPADIAKALAKLEALAKERGSAIGVASAKPATVKQLAEWAAKLEGKDVVLVPVSAAIRSQRQS